MSSFKKPLGRSIAIGCVVFTAILCVVMSVLNFYIQRNLLYSKYQNYISEIIHYVENHIDDEDLKSCIDTLEESDKYKETLLFMDGIMDGFDIHYLYVLKPLYDSNNDEYSVLSILSAEDYYGRYVTLDDNLYLGYIATEEEYGRETIIDLFDMMKQDDIVFFVEETAWGTDYTGAKPLKDDNGNAYALLAVDIDITVLNTELWRQDVFSAFVIIILGTLFTILFILWSRINITRPVKMLEKGVADFASRSEGQRDINALKFNEPTIHTENEVESLSHAISQMAENMQGYVYDLLNAERGRLDALTLATKDSLTGLRNKTAFVYEASKLDKNIEENKDIEFAIAMIDLNFLKVINDKYGHAYGNEALKEIAKIICDIFNHSPVFRVGGDEFVVLLMGSDFENREVLKANFVLKTFDNLEDNEPWKNVSAAIGIAVYNSNIDKNTNDVLNRADEAMYEMKKDMKAKRK